ncbi:MAG: hypothetical protein QOG01_391 [Pseudonocardiales bacterium]|jgi:hypothetical protein|nr:hypothetical protein [Pseudonocardiales bacterium]
MDQPSRRAVLRLAVVGAAGAAFPVVLAQPAGALSRLGPTRLRREVFRPHVGSTFRLGLGLRAPALRLVRIDDLGPRDHGAATRFSLVFETGSRPAAGTYTVRHRWLRPFRLYVGPSGGTPGRYEAVVNS